MGFLLFRAFLAINAFNIATENPIYKYRFKVYPVDTCPMNVSEFESAARRRNCTGNSRYLCAPDIYLSNLIEFCTDRNRLFYGKGNCVRLEGTGDLNHYSCVDRFTSGCPTEPYQDDKIFEYPMCLAINRESKCFISEKNCPERSKEDDERNKGKPEDYVSSYSYVIFIFMIALASVVFGATLLILRKEIKKRTEIKRMKNNHLQMDEKYILLQDIPEEEANDKNVQEVDRNDEMQINENALREYLSKGELTIQHIRCIIVGCAGAGKTTLLSRLKNIPYEELKKIESTEIIDVHVNIFEVNKEEETIKCVDEMNKLPLIIIPSNVIKNDNKTEEEIVDDESVQSKRESEEIVQEKKNSTEKSGTHGISSMERKEFEIYKRVEDMREKKKLLESYENNYSKEDAQDDKEIPNTPDKNSPTIEEESFLQLNKNTTLAHHVDENHAISKIMDALKQLSNEKDLRPRITFLDFAGQSLYYAFHQIYLSKKTCYILVVDMTKDLKKRVPDTDEQCASQFTSWTYEEYYKFWLKSIDSFSDTEAPVVVVGTHADKLSKDECNNFFQTFYDLVNNHFDLRRHLNRKRQFTIGFPESGSNLDELKDIKKCIASLVHDPEKIKPVWALFEHILEKEKIGKVISRKTVSNINEKISKEFRLTDRDITDMLLFLHRVGTLLYFDENPLKETIFLDIQWFAQAFKCIVAYDVDVRKNDDKRERFLHTGEIDDDELNRIWMEKDSVYLSYKTEILSYMEQLGLLAACKTGKKSFYYIPSMNKRRFKDDGETMTKSSILCFQFDKHGQLPVYLFYSIVLKCLKIPEWSILQAKGEHCIYDKVACFSYHHLIVVMCLCKFQIQVQLRLPAEREIVQELREKVQNLVEEKIKECKKYVFQIGYKCENGIFNNEDEDSFVALEKFSVAEPVCNDCPFSKKHYIGKEICWVQRRKQKENSEIIVQKGYLFMLEHIHEELQLFDYLCQLCESPLRDDEKKDMIDGKGFFKKREILKCLTSKGETACREFLEKFKCYPNLYFQFRNAVQSVTNADGLLQDLALTNEGLVDYAEILIDEMEPSRMSDILFCYGLLNSAMHAKMDSSKFKSRERAKLLHDKTREQPDKMNVFCHALVKTKCCRAIEYIRKGVNNNLPPFRSDSLRCVQVNFRKVLKIFKDCIRKENLFRYMRRRGYIDHNTVPKESVLIKAGLRGRKPGCDCILELIRQQDPALLEKMLRLLDYRKAHPRKRRVGFDIDVLRKQRQLFLENLEPMPISHILLEEEAFSVDDHDAVDNEKPRRKKVEVLLDILEKDGSESTLESFFFALRDYPFMMVKEEEFRQTGIQVRTTETASGSDLIVSIPVEGDVERAVQQLRIDPDFKAEIAKINLMTENIQLG